MLKPAAVSLTNCLNPGALREFCQYAAHSLQVPVDAIFLNLLGGAAAAVAGKFTVRRNSTHVEPLQLYTCIIAGPGERKSACVGIVKKSIVNAQRQIMAEEGKDHTERPFFEDATPTALKQALFKSKGKLSCLSPEPDLLRAAQGKFFPKSVLCGAYDGEEIFLDRSDKKTIHIPDPAISICVSAQPAMALEFARSPDVIASGLRGRFLFFVMEPMAGQRLTDTPPIPSEQMQWLESVMKRLLRIEKKAEGRYELRLSVDADKKFTDFCRALEPQLRPGGALFFDQGWSSKLAGKVLRLAGLLHLLQEDNDLTEISFSTLLQATGLAFIFVDHARNFFARADHGKSEDLACEILDWLWKQGVQDFDARDVSSALPHLKKTEVHVGIQRLLETGRIVEIFPDIILPRQRGRSKAQRYAPMPMQGYVPC